MSRIKRKHRKIKRQFKARLWKEMNPTLAMAIIKTYSACQHRKHIWKIWESMAKYPKAWKDYNKNLFGQHLTGVDEIYNTLYFCNRNLYRDFWGVLPEKYALGVAYGVALSYLDKIKERKQGNE